MSSDTVISVQNLSKRYLVGHEAPQESYQSLRDTIVRHGKNFARKTMDMARGRQIIQGDSVEEFWALKDVSFEVKRGEVLGIIGRNGAGKSTLLKILSRITEPTEGRVTLNGRVASLLEVGTGFHPELSGRENIFLNGAILGMARTEIKAKFDEIVDFAGVEKFLDTPVKRYSSGMYVRLAFAVAAHLEPEILIVDEVLAVGDTEFQKKCLGKMQDVAKGGRTVLFVSHNINSIQSLSDRLLLLEGGKARSSLSNQEAIHAYANKSNGTTRLINTVDSLSKTISIVGLSVNESDYTPVNLSSSNFKDDQLHFSIEIDWNQEDVDSVDLEVTLLNQDHVPLLFFSSARFSHEVFRPKYDHERIEASVHIPSLNNGSYSVVCELVEPRNRSFARFVFELEVAGRQTPLGDQPDNRRRGSMTLPLSLEFNRN